MRELRATHETAFAIGGSVSVMRKDEKPPRFSVIVPVAPSHEIGVLESLRSMQFPADQYRVVVAVGCNASRNRNRGVARSRGEILAFTDDDCVVDAQWLTRAQEFFDAHPDYDVVGGPQLTPRSDGFFARACGSVLASWFGTYKTNCRFRQRHPDLAATELALTSANLFIKRSAFLRHGPFDTRLWPNEETELIGRIVRAGGRVAYDPRIVVLHKRRATLSGFVRQCFRYGRGRARQTRIAGTLAAGLGVIVPCAFVSYLALLPLLANVHRTFWLPLGGYGVASLVATVQAVRSSRDPAAALVLPLLFLAVHLAYPLGFMTEAWRLWILRRSLGEIGEGEPETATAVSSESADAESPRVAAEGAR